ncbi:alpha-glucuronidase [Bacillus sp. AFS076308]|uniref:alpha-glucuronidase family glycosyl hydrolase n=1 Tax=unclassified Bacillus (in: firmicutes) TaxID=185979 RepID=UPI000BF5F1D0|nr:MULTISPECIES: alpha-glucuronidase family glycosyl hydrolase [unclassified Bacillus (in: firmicutes)]PFN97238.1 alpha-glucuronidase [Bacillus sp. AFS076308]PGV51668.1 alpha-glucuronidase [Bacillus sp. AFS037270]
MNTTIDNTQNNVTEQYKVHHKESYAAWLQYQKIDDGALVEEYQKWASTIVSLADSIVIQSAQNELMTAFSSMLDLQPEISSGIKAKKSIVLATKKEVNLLDDKIDIDFDFDQINEDGYMIKTVNTEENSTIYLVGKRDAGVLYAAFHLVRLMQNREKLDNLNLVESPKNQLRMINQWDNMDGSIERGYAGKSIFYKDDVFSEELNRIQDYARLLSSVGINAISINNVNVHQVETNLITRSLLPRVADVASIFRAYGIKTFLSINYASTIQLGDLDTADPLDPEVKDWWENKAEEIYRFIPDFGGFLVKADSEHRPGPFTYNRNHADGANMLAEALEPFGGLVIWRCFVYNCLQDWRDRSTDRARAAYDHFKTLDGQFHENVILQIKNGPMDFQVREAVSPLFGAMPQTNQMMEFQVTQEYTGQQRHLCYLVPQWKEILDFDTYANGEGSPVKQVVDGSMFPYRYSGIAAVSNIGNDYNWTGHTLAQANLYGFGRLTWNPDLEAETITNEWIDQAFGQDELVNEQISHMLLKSWEIYEHYTSPLGVGWMVNPHHHYGPNVDGYEYSVWGTYHFADCHGIGVDRTIQTGTGYTAQYFKENTEMYESLDTCPDELLLFFHHVPYTHKLKSGVTVIQHIYNTHFEGVQEAEELKERWTTLKDRIDSERYEDILNRLEEQAAHSKEWRDIINTYFYRKSGIADEQNRKIY